MVRPMLNVKLVVLVISGSVAFQMAYTIIPAFSYFVKQKITPNLTVSEHPGYICTVAEVPIQLQLLL